MQHWDRDPASGDYVMTDGAPAQTDSLTIPAYIRVKSQRKKWLYAPNDRWGSDFGTVKKNRASASPGIIESIGARAVQPLVDDGRADGVTVEAVTRTRYGLGVKINILTASGQQEEITFLPIGG
jgi:phage gp46-like protein